ncbi:hypothetical protein [Persicitalea sp.]|uniref:hypothetical protein n=1 Tax=Persicitalea sp. TaxID=3100273 RepID=UPI0035940565
MKTSVKALFYLMVLLSLSCQKKEVEPDIFSEEVQKVAPQNIIDDLRSWGVSIHSGVTPPDIEGVFTLDYRILVRTYDPDDKSQNGFRITPHRLAFSEQSADNQLVKTEFREIGKASSDSWGKGAVSGSGNKFTFFEEEVYGNSNGVYLRYINVISGEISESGIKDFHEVNAYIKEKTSEAPSHVVQKIGQFQLFKNKDNRISSRTDKL